MLRAADPWPRRIAAGLLIGVLVALRFAALEMDPPHWLSWSGGLTTDEGFYTLDARHEALFGTWARGNFHDRLLSPLLSLMQQAVFQTFGTGQMQARFLAATFGLLTLAAFWWGMDAACGRQAARWAVAILGFLPPFVFYNRLALQETPTVFWLTLAFALWAWGHRTKIDGLFFAAGAAAGIAIIFKALAVICVPAILWGCFRNGRSGWGASLGLGVVLAIYGLFWYGPHHAELGRMSEFYRAHQFMPHGLSGVAWNVRRGFVGDRVSILRGIVPYLLVFAPVPCVLACAGRRALPERILLAWLVSVIVFCLVSSYAPDRYYVLLWPPLAGLAACTLVAMTPKRQKAWGSLLLLTSGIWLAAAWQGKADSERSAGRTLRHLLPAGSVVVGDMAPTLCLNTRLDAVPVQPGLSNDVRPVETVGADYVAVTRNLNSQSWWRARYPEIVQPMHYMTTVRLNGKTTVDIYRVRP